MWVHNISRCRQENVLSHSTFAFALFPFNWMCSVASHCQLFLQYELEHCTVIDVRAFFSGDLCSLGTNILTIVQLHYDYCTKIIIQTVNYQSAVSNDNANYLTSTRF